MAAKKYRTLGPSGETEASGVVVSSGASNDGDLVALDAAGKIDTSVLPDGVGADVKVFPASEALSAGNWVNIWDDSGTVKVRKADASGGVAKQADGYVKAAVDQGNNATVYFDGTNADQAGLTKGAKYYLSATPGVVTATIPTTAAHIAQYLGKAISATEISVEIGEPVIRA